MRRAFISNKANGEAGEIPGGLSGAAALEGRAGG